MKGKQGEASSVPGEQVLLAALTCLYREAALVWVHQASWMHSVMPGLWESFPGVKGTAPPFFQEPSHHKRQVSPDPLPPHPSVTPSPADLRKRPD